MINSYTVRCCVARRPVATRGARRMRIVSRYPRPPIFIPGIVPLLAALGAAPALAAEPAPPPTARAQVEKGKAANEKGKKDGEQPAFKRAQKEPARDADKRDADRKETDNKENSGGCRFVFPRGTHLSVPSPGRGGSQSLRLRAARHRDRLRRLFSPSHRRSGP